MMSQGKHVCQHYYKDVGRTAHVFQYNVMHHWFIEDSYVDMDGLLCEDWPYAYEDRDKADAYQNFLQHAKPFNIPTFPIRRIVTGRLERYRSVTEAWLARHGVRYHALTMHPNCDPRERDSVKLKSEAFKNSEAIMFIESCPHQARCIASTTSRPVLSWEEQRLYNGAEI